MREKDLTLTIAKLIRDMLVAEYENVEVKLTRDIDVFHTLSTRAKIANDWNAHYFMSIHINAGGGTGFESFIHTSRSAGSVNAQDIIHTEIMKQIGDVRDRGKKNANYAVVRETKMPSILTEVLFIDNATDASKLKDLSFLRQVARGHANGLVKLFNLKKKNDTTPNVTQSMTNIQVTPTKIIDSKNRTEYEGFNYRGTTYAPVRQLSESNGRKVKWDGKNVTLE